MSEAEISGPPAGATTAIVDNRLFVLVLQHPQEKREMLATAPLILAAVKNARLVTGLSWPNLTRALGRSADPKRWGVLYLGSVQPGGTRQEIGVLRDDGEPLADPDPILRSLAGIVLIDGSWKEAKTLWWRNPWLLKLHRLVLDPPMPARLGRLRREPRREALSTLEAAALVLRRLETGPAAADALLAALDRLLAGARRPRPPLKNRPPRWARVGRG